MPTTPGTCATVVFGVLISLAVQGCGSEASPRAPDAPGAWGDTPWRLVEEARIGAAEGEGPDVFSSVVDVTLDPLGRAWIADGHSQEIWVFDTRGQPVRTLGRKGGGPAEFRDISGMQWAPDGRLWVLDGGNARFAVYDTAGTLLETRPRQSALAARPWRGRFDRSGRLYDVDGTLAPDGSIVTLLVRGDPEAPARDTFRLPAFEEEVFEVRRGDARNRTVNRINVPFTGSQYWALDPDGHVWVANTARYRIEQHAFDGGVGRVVERGHTPVPVPAGERERRLEDYRDFVRQGGTIDPSRIPNTYPALHGFLFDDAGNLWVSPITPTVAGRAMDVFRPDGTYLGRTALPTPQRSSPRVIRGERMLVVTRDSLDVPTVIVVRIQKTPG